jgi:hypothetical protein
MAKYILKNHKIVTKSNIENVFHRRLPLKIPPSRLNAGETAVTFLKLPVINLSHFHGWHSAPHANLHLLPTKCVKEWESMGGRNIFTILAFLVSSFSIKISLLLKALEPLRFKKKNIFPSPILFFYFIMYQIFYRPPQCILFGVGTRYQVLLFLLCRW